jgi:spore photoproduct lyase
MKQRLKDFSRKKDKVILKPENEQMMPIIIRKDTKNLQLIVKSLAFIGGCDNMSCMEILEQPKTIIRERKSSFVRLFDKTHPEVICPHFYELILSNGCPFNCTYCYLKLTFRGQTRPNLFCNPWEEVQKELDAISCGLFSTGELADSLAVTPPLLEPALDYFSRQNRKYLLLLTKSTNIRPLLKKEPSRQIIVSFSINAPVVWKMYETSTPNPLLRLKTAKQLIDAGWRVRIRLDPIVFNGILYEYEQICKKVADTKRKWSLSEPCDNFLALSFCLSSATRWS